jgi:hypothetical protein
MSFERITEKTMKFTLQKDETDTLKENIQVIKLPTNVQPFVLVKKTILADTDIPSWNTRKLIKFDFTNIGPRNDQNKSASASDVKQVIAQYTKDDFLSYSLSTDLSTRISNYSAFKIIKINKDYISDEDPGEFKNIQEKIDTFDSNGVVDGETETVNIDNNSFVVLGDPLDISLIPYSNNIITFKFKCIDKKELLYDTNEEEEIKIDNMIYIFNNNFTTGFSEGYVRSSIQFKLLMDNTKEIKVVNTTPNTLYNIALRLEGPDNSNITTIDSHELQTGPAPLITLFVEIINGVTNSKINLQFESDDVIFNTFIPEYKEVGLNKYLVSSSPSGLNPEIYRFNISVFKISAVDRITRETISVINFEDTREIEIIMEPDVKTEYFDIDTNGEIDNPLNIQITNLASTILNIDPTVFFPSVNTDNNTIINTIFNIESIGQLTTDNTIFSINLEIVNNDSTPEQFKGVNIPNLSIQIASIYANEYKCFINTAAPSILYNPSISVITATDTLEDSKTATLLGETTQHLITQQEYNFSVKEVDNEFLIEYETNLQINQISKRFDISLADVFFQAYENDKYIFDTSDISSSHSMAFFTNTTINSNNELDSQYVVSTEEGESDSKITLTIPPSNNFQNIYIADFPPGENGRNRFTGICRIEILPNPTNIVLGTFNFSLLVKNGTSTMTLDPSRNSNNIPISGINDLTIVNDITNTTSVRITQLFAAVFPIDKIQIYSAYLSPPENVEFVVFNKTYILLTWRLTNNSNIYPFANPRESRYPIDVYYKVYREDTDTNIITLLGTSIINTFTDITAENFNNYNYYIESVATWAPPGSSPLTLVSQKSEPLFVFVCESNRFPEGRWNNSFSNPKLYKELSKCENRKNITSTLFPNSWSMSRKETYARLAKLSINKR